ncbi:MAG: hypothetical protein A2542_01375 [Parcubacteria group bacterium RIFOXYD2_FULL_52_8]|nr:MAG: hypothetical protein A2542_01375 [Parcubacteria group bacterium RIFOXYD2_FULL_52_8]
MADTQDVYQDGTTDHPPEVLENIERLTQILIAEKRQLLRLKSEQQRHYLDLLDLATELLPRLIADAELAEPIDTAFVREFLVMLYDRTQLLAQDSGAQARSEEDWYATLQLTSLFLLEAFRIRTKVKDAHARDLMVNNLLYIAEGAGSYIHRDADYAMASYFLHRHVLYALVRIMQVQLPIDTETVLTLLRFFSVYAPPTGVVPESLLQAYMQQCARGLTYILEKNAERAQTNLQVAQRRETIPPEFGQFTFPSGLEVHVQFGVDPVSYAIAARKQGKETPLQNVLRELQPNEISSLGEAFLNLPGPFGTELRGILKSARTLLEEEPTLVQNEDLGEAPQCLLKAMAERELLGEVKEVITDETSGRFLTTLIAATALLEYTRNVNLAKEQEARRRKVVD